MGKLFDLILGVIRSVLVLSLYTMAAVIAVTAAAFVICACIRIFGICWRGLFCFPWTF
jgi:hypothetical protein